MTDLLPRCSCILEQPGWREDRDRELVALGERVLNHPWAMLNRTDAGLPQWSCTVGLWHTSRIAELVICGGDRGWRRWVLDMAATALGVAEDLFPVGKIDSGLTSDRAVKIVRVHKSRYGLLQIPFAFYRGELPEYRQLVWADDSGNFPGGGFDPTLVSEQPDLSVPRQSV